MPGNMLNALDRFLHFLVLHMQVNFGGGLGAMAQQCLCGSDVIAIVHDSGGEGVAELVGIDNPICSLLDVSEYLHP